MRRLILLVFLTILTFTSYASEVVLVTPTPISQKEFFETYKVIGQCKAENSRVYNAKVEGTVDQVIISNGQNIKKDQLLISIESNLAEATKLKAEASYASAKQNYERDKSLRKKNISSQEAIERSKALFEEAKVNLILAQDQYNNMIIRAPFDGYVGVIHAQIGDDIKMGDYLFTIISDGEKTISLEIPEELNNRITLDSQVFITDNSGAKIQGTISAISQYVKENGSISVKITFPKKAKILHGSYVEAAIIFNKHYSLAINEKTILKNNQGNFLYQINDNKVKQIYVRTGSRLGHYIEVISEQLSEGDLVVLEGLTKISDGLEVEIIDSIKEPLPKKIE
ncbi:MAG: hypothetical protein DGJ47_000398 [Rickettsiaceae bacterium]